MPNTRHVAKLKEGPEAWNKWLKRQRLKEGTDFLADLTGADLSELNLVGIEVDRVDFSGANLTGTLLNQAKIKNCRFAGATLRMVSLNGAFLADTSFSECDLTESELVGIRARNCDFSNSHFTGTNLFEARFEQSNFLSVVWSNAALENASFFDCELDQNILALVKPPSSSPSTPVQPEMLFIDGGALYRGAVDLARQNKSKTLSDWKTSPGNISAPLQSQFRTREDAQAIGNEVVVIKKVWYGTNRKPVDPEYHLRGYTTEIDEQVHTGLCFVQLPEYRKLGELDPTWLQWLWNIVQGKVSKDVELLQCRHLDWTELAREFPQEIGKEDALVFLHGYRVSFSEAARRAAQISFDLNFPGIMAFYSWPSRGTLGGYPADEEAIRYSQPLIASFLEQFAAHSRAPKIHLLAHSMGNRALCYVLDELMKSPKPQMRLGQVILAAADEQPRIVERILGQFQELHAKTGVDRITLYASSQDKALKGSYILHGRTPRAGLHPPLTLLPKLDTVDATETESVLSLGHGYVSGTKELLHDLESLIIHNTTPNERIGLRSCQVNGQQYWKFR